MIFHLWQRGQSVKTSSGLPKFRALTRQRLAHAYATYIDFLIEVHLRKQSRPGGTGMLHIWLRWASRMYELFIAQTLGLIETSGNDIYKLKQSFHQSLSVYPIQRSDLSIRVTDRPLSGKMFRPDIWAKFNLMNWFLRGF